MMIENRTHNRLDAWTWEVPTDREGEQFYLGLLRNGSTMVVQAMCTFRSPTRMQGDYAVYVGTPPKLNTDTYTKAAWVAEHGRKLSKEESRICGARPVAPNGIRMKWRA